MEQNNRGGVNFGDEITDQLIELSKKDLIISKFIELICYFEKNKNDLNGFTDMPSEEEVEDTLINKVIYVNSCLQNNQFFTEEGLFDLNTELGKVLFLREELLKEICYLICIYYGVGVDGKNNGINEKIERDLLTIKINNDKTFLQNVYNNIIIKNNIMKFFVGTIFISHEKRDVNISDLDYDFIVEQIPQFIKMVYSGQFIKTNGSKFGQEYIEVELDSIVEEEIDELNIRNFISLMVDDLRATNHEFCQKIISEMIIVGRINAKICK